MCSQGGFVWSFEKELVSSETPDMNNKNAAEENSGFETCRVY